MTKKSPNGLCAHLVGLLMAIIEDVTASGSGRIAGCRLEILDGFLPIRTSINSSLKRFLFYLKKT